MGAIEQSVDPRSVLFQDFLKAMMNCLNVFFVVKTAGNAGLICDDEDSDAEVVCLLNCLDSSGNQFELLWIRKVIKVNIDCPISIEENAHLVRVHGST